MLICNRAASKCGARHAYFFQSWCADTLVFASFSGLFDMSVILSTKMKLKSQTGWKAKGQLIQRCFLQAAQPCKQVRH
eukprot:scaffold15509_cov19-Tisochrysis_lutea.AAC.1